MKTLNKMRFIPLLLTLLLIVMMAVPTISMAAPTKVDLLSTSSFAVLAGSTITNTGNTTISGGVGRKVADGDVGVSTGSAIDGFPPGTVTGTKHSNDAPAIQAQTDLVTAYNEAASRATDTTITAALGGGQTLLRGTYTSASSIQIDGDLTLDAQGDPEAVFVFQAGSTLTTASKSRVILANGARYCRIFWQVGSSATLGTNSTFVGHIFAMASITANTGATVQGQLLARTGAVTLDSNTITNGFCAAPTAPSAINIAKTASPTALTSGPGLVTYTYKVTNPGIVALSNVIVTDDKVSPVNYVSGDVNADKLLQTNETWIYTSKIILNATTTNTATATGSANGVTYTDTAIATVVVNTSDSHHSSGGSPQIYPPLINVIKTPEPLALTSGQGSVTYTYKVTNPGRVSLSNVIVTDDKVSPVNYVSGDVNADKLLQTNETWIYTSKIILNATTTNTATAKGSANGKTVTDTASATVIVTPTVSVYPPLINVIKTPEPLALTSGQGSVTYTYKVTNPGKVALSNVSVTDDKVSTVNYVSGDVNADKLLQPNETWIYTSKMNLNVTTTNTATAKGSANGITATDTASATVVVTPTVPVVVTPPVVITPTVPGEKVVTRTVTGGQLPKTSTPLYELLLIGAALTLVGVIGWRSRKRYE